MRQQVGPFVQDVVRECPTCNGVGQTSAVSCSPCDGTGQTTKATTLRFSIPAGAEEGTRLRMRGRGAPAPQGKGQQGDLFIEIEVEEHPWFERSGPDLIMSLPLGYADLVLGTSITTGTRFAAFCPRAAAWLALGRQIQFNFFRAAVVYVEETDGVDDSYVVASPTV